MGTSLATEVLVVGAGPCGATLGNLLGTYGTGAMVVDRDHAIVDYPRAVGIDDESLRTYQAVGLVDELLADIVQNTPIRYYTSWGRCFAHVKPTAQPFGWPRRNLFLQPLYEAVLRRGVERFDSVELRSGLELVDFDQDPDGVTAELKDGAGETLTVRSRWLVGADGGRSTVRRLAGIELTGTTAPVRWLVVDVADDQLDAPYSAVYCDPDQPFCSIPLPYGHRRFEFRLDAGDDEDAVTRPEAVLARLAPRYGSTPLPTLLRARVYLHHSRIASRFRSGRVFLAGDAAHLQPPFFGQGMNSGIRDAGNLAWKLAAVASGRAGDGVLASYDGERRQHAADMVSFATRIGNMYRPRNQLTERARDVGFRALQVIPGGKDYVLQMKYKPMPRYRQGIVVAPSQKRRSDDPVGRMFPQPVVETAAGERTKLDGVVGPWFAVLGVHLRPADHLGPDQLAWWRSLGARLVQIDAPRSGRRRGVGRAVTPPDQNGDVVIEDVDGAFRDWLLARPEAELIVLRPDRYVAAVCDRHGLDATTDALRGLLTDEWRPRRAG